MKESQRIQKVLAAAGHGSRRGCEALVLEGRVQVNGRVVRALPVLVDPSQDDIRVDGRPLRSIRLVYYLLHKPKGVLCTSDDPSGRRLVGDLLIGVKERVYPVGRLDAASTGLLLMTNDGELTQHLTHPRYGVERTYHATVEGHIGSEALVKLKRGIWLAEGRTEPAWIRVLHRGREESVLEIKLRRGRDREVRRILAALGHRVVQLRRTQIGKLSLHGLGPGQFRALDKKALSLLQKVVARDTTSAEPAPKPAPQRSFAEDRRSQQRTRRSPGRSTRVRTRRSRSQPPA